MAVHESSRKVQSNNSILETIKADTEMWLFKSPQPVTRALSNSPAYPSRPAAKVTISVDPLQSNEDDGDNSSATEFTMELTGSDSENASSAYSLNMSTDFYPMSVFSESRSQGEVTVEGKILKKFDMKPQNFERYRKLCQERKHKCMAKSRKIKVIDYIPEEQTRHMPQMDVLSFGTAEKKKKSRRRRVRKESGEMESIIFRLFERQPYWSFKQLIQHTNQPVIYMRGILKRLCVYNRKGVEKRMCYELKPEFEGNITTCEETKLQ